MRITLLMLIVLSLCGCAKTMRIPEEKMGVGGQASLVLDAHGLEGYVTVPLMNSKVIKVTLSELPECVDGKLLRGTPKKLGKAVLTPLKNVQTVSIPSDKKLVISTSSFENIAGATQACSNSVYFVPEADQQYELKVVPHQTFGTQECEAVLSQRSDNEVVPVVSAVYPSADDQGFSDMELFNFCASESMGNQLEIVLEKPFHEVAALLERQTRKCWRREATAFEAGISVRAKAVGEDGALFMATREGLVGDVISGQRYRYSPFIKVALKSLTLGSTKLSVVEGELCLTTKPCADMKFREHLSHWLEGNTECQSENYSESK